ncbi:MAG: hypothetical protein HYY37_01520 [Candidatus Aenigmarchaeota archaeon]|nr:hypothetical protein [Candidatus Aenigmarchaeota archaeon]
MLSAQEAVQLWKDHRWGLVGQFNVCTKFVSGYCLEQIRERIDRIFPDDDARYLGRGKEAVAHPHYRQLVDELRRLGEDNATALAVAGFAYERENNRAKS